MVNKPKSQGTAWERELLLMFQGVDIRVSRLSEGGAYDLGDLLLEEFDLVIEAKDRSNLNLHETLAASQKKAARDDLSAVVAWKRKARKPGNSKRSQVGPPLVALPLVDFVEVLVELKFWRKADGATRG